MSTIPFSRVVNVDVTRTDNFVARSGFGIQLVLTTTAVVGSVDAANRTKIYSNMEEVANDWDAADAFYSAALSAFSQNPRPINLKAGYIDPAVAVDEAGLVDELDAIWNVDQKFYMVTLGETALRDDAMLDGLISWVEAKPLMALIDSNDALLQDPLDDTNIAARHKGTVERTGIFYHTDSAEYLAASIAGYMATRNFDQTNSAYTVKFKKAPAIAAVNVGSAALTAITAFKEELGQDEAVGHCANTLVDIGGQDLLLEGSTLSQNVFLDEIHASDWIQARTEEQMLDLFLNNARIPYTDQGMQQLASVARTVMAQASRAGLVADDRDPATGEYAPAIVVTVPSVFDVPETQRKARVSPAITVMFRYAGAVHYTTVHYTMTF